MTPTTAGAWFAGLTFAASLPGPLRHALEQGDDTVEIGPEGVLVRTDWLRSLSDPDLQSLGLTRFGGTLKVTERGAVQAPSYQWELTWESGTAEVLGPWLLRDRPLLLAAEEEAVYTLAQRLREIGEGPRRAAVFSAIARLQELAARRPSIRPQGLLASRRLVRANALRLGVEPDPAGGPGTPAPVVGWSEAGRFVPADLSQDDLLMALPNTLTFDTTVALPGGRHLILSAKVARNTLLSLAAAEAPDDLRADFLANPTAFLPDVEAFDEADYSARVVGKGEALRRAPEGQGPGRVWATPTDGLLVALADRELWVTRERLPDLIEAVRSARAAGDTATDWDGGPVPVSEAIEEALASALRTRPERPPATEREPSIVLRIHENEVVVDWAPAMRPRKVEKRALPPTRTSLQAHQRQGIAALIALWEKGDPGALLCDDMGLGKTLQAIVFAAWVNQQRQKEHAIDIPMMIVAPPSLLASWLKEMEQHLAPDQLPTCLWGQAEAPPEGFSLRVLRLRDYLVGGGGQATVLQDVSIDLLRLAEHRPDVLLIGYDTLRRLQFAIGRLTIGLLIADEAQEAKDPSSLRSQALRAMNQDFRLALTGTPIENSWRDLWTLCDFAVPGRLGPLREFTAKYPASGDVASLGGELYQSLRPVMLRRLRATALPGLPELEHITDRRVMPPEQATRYRAELVAGTRGAGILGLLQGLGRISLHPRVRAELQSAQEAREWIAASARTAALWGAIHRWREEGAAGLVFVRSLAMQETLQRALILDFQLPYVGILNGQVSLSARRSLVERAAALEGFRVLIVSPDVGGAGWNLQFACRSAILERPFNPAVESQMVARTHRLGQTRRVEVLLPVATLPEVRSYDDVLHELLEEKRSLSDAVLAPSSISDDELSARFQSILGVHA